MTNRLDIVTRDAVQDILPIIVAKVSLQINIYTLCYKIKKTHKKPKRINLLKCIRLLILDDFYNTFTKCTFLCKVCPSGHYGKNCRESCSRHCIDNEQCDHVSGVCMSGCQDGFLGTHCNDCKTSLQPF